MNAEKILANISGTTGGFTGSHAVVVALLVGQSGANYIPVRVTDDGTLLTSGVN